MADAKMQRHLSVMSGLSVFFFIGAVDFSRKTPFHLDEMQHHVLMS